MGGYTSRVPEASEERHAKTARADDCQPYLSNLDISALAEEANKPEGAMALLSLFLTALSLRSRWRL